MVNHRLQSTDGIGVGSFLLFAILVVEGWAGPSAAGQAPAQSPVKKSAPGAASKSAQAKPASAVGKRAVSTSTTKRKSPRRAKAAAQQKPAAKGKPGTTLISGRRDPFKPPPPPAEQGVAGLIGPLPPGTRGLLISQLLLEGIVRLDSTNKMIAVVTNNTKRAYFLRENDTVYDGVVSKITPDAVYFKENHLDPRGRVTSMEVVKRLGSAPGEGR